MPQHIHVVLKFSRHHDPYLWHFFSPNKQPLISNLDMTFCNFTRWYIHTKHFILYFISRDDTYNKCIIIGVVYIGLCMYTYSKVKQVYCNLQIFFITSNMMPSILIAFYHLCVNSQTMSNKQVSLWAKTMKNSFSTLVFFH